MDAWRVGWFEAQLSTHDAVRELLGPTAVTSHLCPACGATDHGRPEVTVDGRTHAVSASRARGWLVVVTRPADRAGAAALGVDLEPREAAPPPADLVLHPSEEGLDPLHTWVAKEAILKLLGVGLNRPMTTIRARDHRVTELDAPPGLLALVATQDAD